MLGVSKFLTRADLFADGGFKLIFRYVKLVMLLKVHPVLRRGAEVPGETQCGFPANSTRAIDDRGDAVGGDVERLGELVLGEADVLQIFGKNLTGVNGRKLLLFWHTVLFSVIVHNLDVFRIRLIPPKADSPLAIVPNAVLAPPVALQGFHPIPPYRQKLGKAAGRIKPEQSPARGARNALKPVNWHTVEEVLGIGAAERLDHHSSIMPLLRSA